MSSGTSSPLRTAAGLAPVIALAARRPARRSPAGIGLRSLGAAFVLAVGVACALGALGLLAATVVRHAIVVLPAVVVLATLATWPVMARRLGEAADEPGRAGPAAKPRRGRVLQYPAHRRIRS